MRRAAFCCLLLLLSGALFGCVRMAVQDGDVYQVYFLCEEENMGLGDVLVPESRILAPGTEPVSGLLDCLLEGPEEEGLSSALPGGVTIKSWNLEDGLLTIDFSARYSTLSGISLSLADYSIVKTMTQLEQVDAVEIKADGNAIFYRDHQSLTESDVWNGETETPAEEPPPEATDAEES